MSNELDDLRAKLKQLERENAKLKSLPTPLAPLPLDEQPEYEVVNGLVYTADNQQLPPGVTFRDLYGTMIPSEATLPLNDAAKRRYAEWQRTLPAEGDIPMLDHMLEAAVSMRGSDLAGPDWQKAVLARAIDIKHGPAAQRPRVALAPHRPTDAPLMTNVRMKGRESVAAAQSVQITPSAPSAAPQTSRFNAA